MRMIIATGGTGGHIYPALALAKAAQKKYKDIEILFIGNDDRMEANLIPQQGYSFIGLHTSGLVGGISGKAKAIIRMAKAYRKALAIIDEFKPDVAIGFGGYVTAPVMFAAHRKKVKTMIHEQNSIVGKSNRVVANYMDAVVVCYEKCIKDFEESKTRLLGNPRATEARDIVFDEAYFSSLGLNKDKPVVLVVMGSLGSTSINEMMKEMLPKVEIDAQIIFVTGKNNDQNLKEELKNTNVLVVDYIKQLEIMEHVDLMICRAGATTAAEITALGVPSILIPSPYVANNHQFYNASVLVEKKAAFMIEEKDLNADVLQHKIELIMNNEALREEMRKNALSLGKPNASEDILDWIDEMVKDDK